MLLSRVEFFKASRTLVGATEDVSTDFDHIRISYRLSETQQTMKGVYVLFIADCLSYALSEAGLPSLHKHNTM